MSVIHERQQHIHTKMDGHLTHKQDGQQNTQATHTNALPSHPRRENPLDVHIPSSLSCCPLLLYVFACRLSSRYRRQSSPRPETSSQSPRRPLPVFELSCARTSAQVCVCACVCGQEREPVLSRRIYIYTIYIQYTARERNRERKGHIGTIYVYVEKQLIFSSAVL